MKKNLFFLTFFAFFFLSKQPLFAQCEDFCGRVDNRCSYTECYGCDFCNPEDPCPSFCDLIPSNALCSTPGCESCGSCQYLPDQNPPGAGSGSIRNPVLPSNLSALTGETFLSNLLRSGINFIFVVGSVVFFFILVTGGIKWISSSGDKARLESAQKQVTSGLVGMVILLSSFAIIKLVGSLFGVDLLNITLPTL